MNRGLIGTIIGILVIIILVIVILEHDLTAEPGPARRARGCPLRRTW